LQGWWAVRILQGFHQLQSPRDELDKADVTVTKLSELLPLFPARNRVATSSC
jgi:hypothetical protein